MTLFLCVWLCLIRAHGDPSLTYNASYSEQIDGTTSLQSAEFQALEPDDYETSVTLEVPGIGSRSIPLVNHGIYGFYYQAQYTSLSQLESAFPEGTYGFEMSLNGEQGYSSIPVETSLAPPNVLTEDSVEALASDNVGQPINIAFNDFNVTASTLRAQIELNIQPLISLGFGLPILQETLAPSSTQFAIPANTLEPDTTYGLFLSSVYSNDIGGAPLTLQIITDNEFLFTTSDIPEPSTLGLVAAALGGFGLMRIRRAEA